MKNLRLLMLLGLSLAVVLSAPAILPAHNLKEKKSVLPASAARPLAVKASSCPADAAIMEAEIALKENESCMLNESCRKDPKKTSEAMVRFLSAFLEAELQYLSLLETAAKPRPEPISDCGKRLKAIGSRFKKTFKKGR